MTLSSTEQRNDQGGRCILPTNGSQIVIYIIYQTVYIQTSINYRYRAAAISIGIMSSMLTNSKHHFSYAYLSNV